MRSNYPLHLQKVFEAVDFALEQEEVYKVITLGKRRKEVPFYKRMKKYFNDKGVKLHKNKYPIGTTMPDVVFEIGGQKFWVEVGHRTIIQSEPAFWTVNKARDGFRKMVEGNVDPSYQICIEILTDIKGDYKALKTQYPVCQSYLSSDFNTTERTDRLNDVMKAIINEYGNNWYYFVNDTQIDADLQVYLHVWVIWKQI